MLAKDPARRTIYAFGPFQLDPAERRLVRDGRELRLSPKVFETLVLLVEHHGLLVEKDELMKLLWPGTFVEEVTLARNISHLRKALGDTPGQDDSQYIATISKSGYRFIAPVTEISSGDQQDAAPSTSAAVRQKLWARPALWITLALVLPLLGFAAFWGYRWLHHPPAPISSLAVLPLENLSRDPEQEYFADGMTDELITNLAQIHPLRVISRSSAMHFKGTNLSVREIAQQLGVDAVVEGSVTRSGNHVRITAQLVDARQDRHLWAGSYVGEMSDVLNLQDTVATSIAREVNTKLTSTHEERQQRPIQPAAYEAYLKGWYFWNKSTWEGWQNAIQYFQESIDADPNYAPAYVGLSDSYAMLNAHNGAHAIEVMPKAKAAAQKALMLDDSLGEAHVALANVLFGYEWDWVGAEREYQRGIQLSPNYALGYLWHATLLEVLGRQAEGIAEHKRAVMLDPLSLFVNTNLCRAYLFANQLDAAIQQCRQTLELDPHYGFANRWLTQALYEKGAYQEYVEALESGAKRAGVPEWADEMNKVFSAGGIERFQRYMAEDDLETMKETPMPAWRHAKDYVALGDKENALRWLEKSYEDRDFGLLIIGIDDEFAPLRSEPRYINIRRKMNLPQ